MSSEDIYSLVRDSVFEIHSLTAHSIHGFLLHAFLSIQLQLHCYPNITLTVHFKQTRDMFNTQSNQGQDISPSQLYSCFDL